MPARTKSRGSRHQRPAAAANKTKTRKCGRAARTARSAPRKRASENRPEAPCGRRWCLIRLSAGQSHTSSNGFQRRFLLCRFNLRGSTALRATLLYDARPGFATPLGAVRRLPQSGPVRRTAGRGRCSALTALFFRLSSPPWMSGPSMRNICASPPEIAAGYLRRVQGYAPPPAPASARSRVPVRFPR